MSKTKDKKKKKEKKKLEEERKMDELEKNAQSKADDAQSSETSESDSEQDCDQCAQMQNECDEQIAQAKKEADKKIEQYGRMADEKCRIQLHKSEEIKDRMHKKVDNEIKISAQLKQEIEQINNEFYKLRLDHLAEKKKLQMELHNAQQKILEHEEKLFIADNEKCLIGAQTTKKSVAQQIVKNVGQNPPSSGNFARQTAQSISAQQNSAQFAQQSYAQSTSAQQNSRPAGPPEKIPSKRTLAITYVPTLHIAQAHKNYEKLYEYAHDLLGLILQAMGQTSDQIEQLIHGKIEHVAGHIKQIAQPTGRDGRLFVRMVSEQIAQQIATICSNGLPDEINVGGAYVRPCVAMSVNELI